MLASVIAIAPSLLAQAPPPTAGASAPSAATVFYVTLLLIFVTAIVTTVATKWSRKALKFFHGYHVTLERSRGHTTWGKLRVFSSGIEIVYDHAYVDYRGRKKTSFLMYGPEVDQQLLSVLRYHDEL